MNKAQREALTADWPTTLAHVRQQYPDLTDSDVKTTDPDKLVANIRSRTGASKGDVEATMRRIGIRVNSPGETHPPQ